MCKTMLQGLALVRILGPAAVALLPALGFCFFRCPKPQARKCVHGDSRKFQPQPINRSQVSLAHHTRAFISQSLSFLSWFGKRVKTLTGPIMLSKTAQSDTSHGLMQYAEYLLEPFYFWIFLKTRHVSKVSSSLFLNYLHMKSSV